MRNSSGWAFLFIFILALRAEAAVPASSYGLTPADVAVPTIEWSSFTEFSELRDHYAKRADFLERCNRGKPEKEFMQLAQQGDDAGAAEAMLKWLEHCPVDATGHLWAANALKNSGNAERAEDHFAWFIGLTDSAMSHGDGLSTSTAYRTISVAEEYAILTRLGLEIVKQSLIMDPKPLDALLVKDESGHESTLYFDPHWHFVRLRFLLQQPP